MEWHEDPRRIHDAVRSASWRGAWRMLGAQFALLIPAAILFPAFAQSKWSGPKTNPETIAYAITRIHDQTGRWTNAFADVDATVHGRGPSAPYHVAFVKLVDGGATAEYAITVNGNLRRFRVGVDGRPKTIGDPVASGTLKP